MSLIPAQNSRSRSLLRFICWIWCLCAFLLVVSGCTRRHYFLRADRATYGILDEKTAGTPWSLPPNFNILPRPTARFFDPTPIVDPLLPIPAPKLYAFQLPEIPKRDASRFQPEVLSGSSDERYGPVASLGAPVFAADALAHQDEESDERANAEGPLRLATFQEEEQPGKAPQNKQPETLPFPVEVGEEGKVRLVPIPQDVWKSIPLKCLRRMLEFRSVREEYEKSYGKAPDEELRDPSPRLALEDLVKLGLTNSRAYQSQKELLYSAALRLTLERYNYDLRFAPFNNGTDVDYLHSRNRGITVNTLGIPTQFNGGKILATGGDLLARFANDVVLTFNGPEGFAMDVGSELLLDISQAVFQRDIVFETLTQAERNVVYAARDFARFRKFFFRDIAFQYYSLILTYRQVEIDTQDYFSNLRAFLQAQAELRLAGLGSRIQVDQIEQSVLASRSRLIGTCNRLASRLDNLKFLIGIPPELPMNLDLTELEQLTLRDEATVVVDLIRRARRDIQRELDEETPDQTKLVNDAVKLADRLLEWIDKSERLGQKYDIRGALEELHAHLLVDDAVLLVEANRAVLAEKKKAVPKSPPELIFQRTIALIDSLQKLIGHQLNLAVLRQADKERVMELGKRLISSIEPKQKLREEFAEAVKQRALERIPAIVKSAESLLSETEKLSADAAKLLDLKPLTPKQRRQKTLADAAYLLSESNKLLEEETAGLAPIELDMDDGMLTALVTRFDLMNQRGILADQWRRIKLAGDDLKSILNLNAAQVIRTEKDRPFGFTWDESETRLSLSFDAPLNRIAQRNQFRLSLINYQAALRNLIELEDGIKIEIRDDLRDLTLDREQYLIAVSSAALASERVTSVREALRRGVEDVSARDFVEAQRTYASSLAAVASQHITYIRDRISLFLDLELLTVDDEGFWPKLYDEDYQPMTYYQMPPVPPYGTLPPDVWYSRKVKRMLDVPPGQTMIFDAQQDRPADQGAEPEPLPFPAEVNGDNAEVLPVPNQEKAKD